MTPKQELIEMKLGEPLLPFIQAHRSQGASWDAIARAVWQRTGVTVSDQTIRNYAARTAA
jgi:hypothetical protein